jgi:transcriptional regulator with AAA-type ATPase domain
LAKLLFGVVGGAVFGKRVQRFPGLFDASVGGKQRDQRGDAK